MPGSFSHFHLVKGFEEVAVAPHSRPVRTSVGDAVDLTYQIVWDENRVAVAVQLGLVVAATLDQVVDGGGRILVRHCLLVQLPHIHRAPPPWLAIRSGRLWHEDKG